MKIQLFVHTMKFEKQCFRNLETLQKASFVTNGLDYLPGKQGTDTRGCLIGFDFWYNLHKDWF